LHRVTAKTNATALCAEPDDAAELTARLVQLVDDPELRATMGSVAREKATQMFDKQKQMRALWSDILVPE